MRIGFGRDSGSDPYRGPGIAEQRELALFVRVGLTPSETLTVPTRDAAGLMDLADRGALEPGRRADFVVLAAALDAEVWRAGRRSRS